MFADKTKKYSAEVLNAETRLWQFLSEFFPFNKAQLHPSQINWIIGLGCTDLRVADASAELWLENHTAGGSAKILFSGGFGRLSRANQPHTEADLFQQRAISLGVNTDAIVLERQSRNTSENIAFARNIIANLEQYSVAFVCRNIFRPRVYAVIKRQLPDLYFSLVSPCLSYQDYAETPELKAQARSMMAGEIERLKTYPEQGWQISLTIPVAVQQAQQLLYSAGFTSQQIRKL